LSVLKLVRRRKYQTVEITPAAPLRPGRGRGRRSAISYEKGKTNDDRRKIREITRGGRAEGARSQEFGSWPLVTNSLRSLKWYHS
jgi:hypothetical protein